VRSCTKLQTEQYIIEADIIEAAISGSYLARVEGGGGHQQAISHGPSVAPVRKAQGAAARCLLRGIVCKVIV
jgi:hypothetical protein